MTDTYAGFEAAMTELALEEIKKYCESFRVLTPHVFFSTPYQTCIFGQNGLGKKRLLDNLSIMYPDALVVKTADELFALLQSKKLRKGTAIMINEEQ